jgi:regulator of replication initiation timing
MNYLKIGLIGAIALSLVDNILLRTKVKNLDKELGTAKSNVTYYQNLVSNKVDENRVLQLSINDFKQSNDSLLTELSKTKDQLKIKDKQLNEVTSVTTVLTDTIVETISIDRDFDVELKPNDQTIIKISRVGEQLTCIPTIYNRQDLFVTEEKVYRNKYKNKFSRFIHFDFKKDKVLQYKISNSNDAIQVLDTRIVRISK